MLIEYSVDLYQVGVSTMLQGALQQSSVKRPSRSEMLIYAHSVDLHQVGVH